MFEYEGKQYSLEQVELAAKQYNMSVEDYIGSTGIVRLNDEPKGVESSAEYMLDEAALESNKIPANAPGSNVSVPTDLLENMSQYSNAINTVDEFESQQGILTQPVSIDMESEGFDDMLPTSFSQGSGEAKIDIDDNRKIEAEKKRKEEYNAFIEQKTPQVTSQLDSLKGFYPTIATPQGDMLNIYDDEAKIEDFNNKAVSDYIVNDKDVQDILLQKQSEKKSIIDKEFKQWFKKFEGMEFEDFTKEQLKEVDEYYNSVVNKHVLYNNKELNVAIDRYSDILGSYHAKSSKNISKDRTVNNWLNNLNKKRDNNAASFSSVSTMNPMAQNIAANSGNTGTIEHVFRGLYKAFPNSFQRAFSGFRGIGTGITKGGLAVNSPANHIYNLQKLEEEAELFNYDDNTVGYFNEDGRFLVHKEGGIHPKASGYTVKGTYGEAKERLQNEIYKRKSLMAQDFDEVLKRMEVDAAFEHADFRDIFESGKRLDYIGNLLLEQGSQMGSAIVTFGILPAAQMGGENYYNQVRALAKKKFGVVSPTSEMMMDIVENDVNNEIWDSAAGVGFVSGAAEYFGARMGFDLAGSSLRAVQGSLVKGQYKSWLKTLGKVGKNAAIGSFDEFLTETFQQFANDVTTGEFIKENYIQGGGAGAVMGFVLPGIGGVSSMTATEIQATYQRVTGKIDVRGLNQFHKYVKANLKNDLDNNKITKEQYDAKLQLVDDMYTRSEMVTRELDDAQKDGLMESVFEREEARKNLNEVAEKHSDALAQEAEEQKRVEEAAKQAGVEGPTQGPAVGPITNRFLQAQKRFYDSVQKTEFIKDFNKETYDAIKAFAEAEGVSDMIIENTDRNFAIKYLELKDGISNPTEAQINDRINDLKNRPGAFITTVAGKKQIIINAESAIRTGNTSVAGHEIKHRLLYNMMQDFSDQVDEQGVPIITKIVASLNDYVVKLATEGKIQGIRDDNAPTDFIRSMLPYMSYDIKALTKVFPQLKGTLADKQGFTTYSQIQNVLSEFMTSKELKQTLLSLHDSRNSTITPGFEDEYFTMLSQGLNQGTIKYNADFMENVGDGVRRMSQLYGKGEIQFNDGKDVFNFIRDYNKSITKQKATSAQLRFAESNKDNKSRSFKGDLFDGARTKIAEDTDQLVDQNEKFSITERQEELSNEVQRIYEEDNSENKIAAIFQIAEMYRPQFRNLTKRRGWDALPGWSVNSDIIEDEALTGTKYLPQLIKSYKPEKNVPLAAYLNKYFKFTAQRAVSDVLGDEVFKDDVDELRGGGPAVESEEVYESVEQAIQAIGTHHQGEFSRIRRKMELTPVEMNKVRAVATRALVLAPGITDQKKYNPQVFRSFINETYKKLLYSTFLDFVPTRRVDFIQWARKNKSWLQKEMTLNTLRKFPALEGVLYEFITDEKGNRVRYSAEEASKRGIRDKYSGVAKVKRKIPTKQEWDNYLDPTRVGMSQNMPHEHKRVLVEALSIELGLDATLEVMQNPNQQVFDMNGEAIEGREINVFSEMVKNNADALAENQVIGRAAFIIDRDASVKFSIAGESAGYSDTRMAELIFENPGPILEAFKAAVNPYRLMSAAHGDTYNDRLRSHLTQNLLGVFKKDYKWMDERSAAAIAPQLARDFMTIHRQIDSLKMLANKEAENEFMKAIATNLYNISETITFNKGYSAVIKDAEPLSTKASEDLMGQVFVSKQPEADKAIIDYILGKSKSPHKDVNDLTVAKATYFGNRDETSASAELNNDIANALVNAKTLYENNLISRDQIFNLIQTIFEGTQGQDALIDFAAVPSVVMKGINVNNRVKVHTYPKNFLSAALTNAIVNKNHENNTLFRIMDEFATMTVTRPYADLIKEKHGQNMPHYRDGEFPSMLSRIARLKVGKKGNSIMQFYRPPLKEVIGKTGEDLVEFSSKFFELDYSGPQYEIDLNDMIQLDYNNDLARNISDLLNDDDVKFSIANDQDGKGKRKKPKKPKTLKQLDAEIQAIRDDVEEKGILKDTDPEEIEAKRLEEYAQGVDKQFNEILQENTGVDADTEYSRVAASVVGRNKNRFIFFVPPKADDFRGLIENYLVGKGEKGEAQLAFFEEMLHQPYEDGVNNYSSERVRIIKQWNNVRKAFKPLMKQIKKEAVPGLSIEHAIRIYIWTRLGKEIPGINEQDQKAAHSFVLKNGMARDLAIEVMKITDLHGHIEPKKYWDSGGLLSDIFDSLRVNSRKKYLQEFTQNADIIFSEKNMNKLKALYGKNYVEAMENMLIRMNSGRNRVNQNQSKLGKAMMSWLNGSVGVTMFLNTRSATLQLISFSNYIDMDVNPIHKAVDRYTDVKQFWSDAIELMNSDYMIERRQGLKIDVNEAELADATNAAPDKFKAAISWLLSKGFAPTKVADSLAIVFGGAPYYRNAVIKYKKLGLEEKEAEQQAFIDFRRKTEESQQSSSPERISMQQADPQGRMLLTYANTQSQYARIIKKELNNLKKGRGDAIKSVSRIAYYGIMQNALFIAMQTAVLPMLLGDQPDQEKEGIKNRDDFKIINGVLDSFLRGAGIAGHLTSVIKNTGISAYDRYGRPNPDFGMLLKEVAQAYPSLGSKVSRGFSTGYYFDKAVRENRKESGLASEYFFRGVATGTAMMTNTPLDRMLQKFENVKNAVDLEGEFETYQQVLMFMGWPDYQLGIDQEDTNAHMGYYLSNDGKVYKRKSKSKKKKRPTYLK